MNAPPDRPDTPPAVPPIDERRAALLDRFPVWQPMTLDERLRSAAAVWPDRPLVLAGDATYTYDEVERWAQRLADGLLSIGVGPGDHVAVIMANHPEFVPLKFGIARVGAVAVPLNFLYRPTELSFVLRQSRCSHIVVMSDHLDQDYLDMLDRIMPGWEHGNPPGWPLVRQVIVLWTGVVRRDCATLDDLAAGVRRPSRLTVGDRSHTPDGIGDILYTSGTTGQPKGVMLTHDAVQRSAYASALTRAFEDGRRSVFSMPFYHMFGYIEGLLAVMMVGGAIIPLPRFSASGYFAAAERYGATDILCVPTMTVALLEYPDRAAYDLSSVFACLCAAAASPLWIWEAMREDLGITEITTGYGMTEAGGGTTMTLPEDPLELHVGTVGRPRMAGAAGIPEAGDAICRYRVCDPVTHRDLEGGTEGELVSSGPAVMIGFWDIPDDAAPSLVDGWLFSGDIGRVLAGGYVQLTGRTSDLYKSGGELVMPKEVEDVLCNYPGVSQAFVVGIPDQRWGEAGCAWIVADAGVNLTGTEILDHCRSHLARFKVPRTVRFLESAELPLTPTGKVQKFRLKEMAEGHIPRIVSSPRIRAEEDRER